MNVVFFFFFVLKRGAPWVTGVWMKMRCTHVAAPWVFFLVLIPSSNINKMVLNDISYCVAPHKKNRACVCWWVRSHLNRTRPSKFEPVQRTEMTSSLPHPVLLEDLSKTCGSALPAHCKLIESWTRMFFLLLEDVCVCAQAGFILLSWIFFSLSGFWLHLSLIWLVAACSSGFGQTGQRPAELEWLIHTVLSVWACVYFSVTPNESRWKA